ncbi:hypothetical protein [Microbacterium aurum]|uniref:hypothetical protein n=1 Tax=Microbacterium aurum TaxID=36805 RepID=UPI0028E5277E|nr:hypothetical protein [Microbacterium aurum]
MTTVDARFAGGPIIVEADDYPGDLRDDVTMVRVAAPGAPELLLFPHEAQAFALAIARELELGAAQLLAGLIDHENEQRSTRSRTVRRDPAADERHRQATDLY